MSKRREGREAAVQFLFQQDIQEDRVSDLRGPFWKLREAPQKVQDFANRLVDGVNKNLPDIDGRIKKYAINFELARLNVVDRNILRLAIYEMLHCLDVPPIVTINEAIEIAKKFGGDESGKFVNGILDKVKLELNRPLREATKPQPKTTVAAKPEQDN